ncbi:alanine--tRNA ligase [Candidatus Kaiserbacteria bacterium CG10_big_fil_rev_8_21_14_0_10_44_10]|uniref:alanine--tRNA ligase n=1 Tax=Candidatus Kaiserbacteria bacterium CG10_big_fil_rev_8_21_14_0_10_44_10 TaxID=1974606 RepID=A0A2H0UHB0_9BACT|nr:MAG: alanine--tRNA ligase [Candidatus Kaiserbacteria bacterium CG10_big_fil_rev_8_21_14_0_10_44_10]
MSGNEIREKYLKFMEERKHAIVPSSALVPENDPTTLFTGSGMQPMLPYLLGEIHPKGTRIVDSQKCFRAEDIEEVGDNRHTTFFEMLGNWSFGDYFKEEQIEWMFEFLTKEIGIDPNRLYITVFGGDENNNLPKDEEAPKVWQRLFADKGITAEVAIIGSEDEGYKRGMKDGERIFYYEAKKNWWSRAGVPDKMPVGEPGGPDSEMFYDFGTEHDPKWGEHCHPNCDCGRFMEIGNNVFMQYVKTGENKFEELKNKNIDFGGGLERIVAAKNDDNDVFKIDLLWSVVAEIQNLSGKKYEDDLVAFRVVTDHIRGATFMIGDGVLPGNTEQGYFVRRLLRRAVRYADQVGIPAGQLSKLAEIVIHSYETHYTNLKDQKDNILDAIAKEEEQFRKTLEKGMKEFEKLAVKGQLSGDDAFLLFTTYGFPYELTEELAQDKGLTIDKDSFSKKMKEHQALSRAGAEQKFKGGLADHSEKVVQYHTATHLMLAGLRKFLGSGVHQAGSNITGERLRFDFTHPDKVERDVLDKVEEFVNNAIQVGGPVRIDMMPKTEAETDPTIEGSFWDRYPDEVKVYTITGNDGEVFSRELCGGPHVEKLEDIQGTFRITKEESSSAGVRRVKAVLE